MVRSGSIRRSAVPAPMPAPAFTVSPADYRLLEEVGYGANAVVYRAEFIPTGRTVAVKCLDLDRVNSNLDDVRKETQTMSLIDHPNVIRSYCSFVVGHNLWVVMPFMSEGSCLHLMKVAYPDGFEEPIIASILKETLKALDYLHRQGHIHRDVKAGNILIDNPGVVKLGDFGVSACMFDRGDRQRARNTFVGTPCWMAPEVLQPGTGYNFKADIWSFGITALELAHGHAPFSKYPPMKVLLMTLQNAPPGLDYDRDKRFSKSFKEMVAMCLVKDQTKRPTAEKLLKHSFFKNAKPPELTVKNILTDLPPLWDRVKALQLKDAAQLALKRMPSSEQEALSMSEYQRGVSAWNFDIEDLKAQASLICDDDPPEIKEDDDTGRITDIDKDTSSDDYFGKTAPSNGNNCSDRSSVPANPGQNGPEINEILSSNNGNAYSERKPDGRKNPESENDSLPSTSKHDADGKDYRCDFRQKQRTYSGPVLQSGPNNSSMTERGHIIERDAGVQSVSDKQKNGTRRANNLSGPLSLPTRASANSLSRANNLSGPLSLPTRASANSLSAPIRSSAGYVGSLGDKPKRTMVEIKGRFSVTSENVDLAKVQEIPGSSASRKLQEGPSLRKSASVGDWSANDKTTSTNHQRKELCNSSVSTSILIPHLQNLVKQTAFQQDLITNLLSSLQQNERVDAAQSRVQSTTSDTVVEAATAEREHSLLVKIFELQSRMISLTDELIAAKLKHVQLQEELNVLYCQEEILDMREDESEEA
ncbi:ATP binding protein isoform X1 [Zea mays]|uniref:Protein kinase superfamily protein n=2 Tax=Zea mays TaxID=4577 RepID=A0A1D6JL63_MAIZE|nr:ATP binding protein isoform X1 [Zea mays]ONL92890.1 Protein kinase superfamily protein [Zea mays]|eukprot:XP_023158211.1 ATP binding protein isoform X1 [Zea mays]